MNKFLGVSLISAFGAMVVSSAAWSQEKSGFHYQGAVRRPNGLLVANKQVSVRLSLLEGSETGPTLYWEVNNVTTNEFGLYGFDIGHSDKSSKTFHTIDWDNGNPVYLKIEIDPNGGLNWLPPKISLLATVPYSLYAKKGGTSGYNYWKALSGNEDKTFEDYIKEVSSPVLAGDIEGGVNTTQIKEGAITVDKLAQGSVSLDKMAPGTANQILVTNADGVVEWYDAQGAKGAFVDKQTIIGEGTIVDPVKLADNSLLNKHISSDAAIDVSKLSAATTSGQILTSDGSKATWISPAKIMGKFGAVAKNDGTSSADILTVTQGADASTFQAVEYTISKKALNQNTATALQAPTTENGGNALKDGIKNVAKEAVREDVSKNAIAVNTGQDVISVASNEGSTLKSVTVSYNQESADLASANSLNQEDDKATDGQKKLQEAVRGQIGKLKVTLGGDVTGEAKTSSIAANAITTEKIKDRNVTPDKIQKGTNGQLLMTKGDDVVWTNPSEVVTLEGDVKGLAGTNTIIDGKITEAKLADASVSSGKIANNAVVEAKIADNAVTTDKIKEGAVTGDKLQNDVVTEIRINDQAVATDKIKNENVTEAKLATDAVTENKIKDGAITETKLVNNVITTAKIKDEAVTPAKIEKGSEGQFLMTKGENVIWSNAATAITLVGDITGEAGNNTLGDGKVTEAKIAANAVVEGKIQNNAVTTVKINNNAVTEAKLASDAVVEGKIKNDAVVEGKIKNGAVTDTKIKDAAVTETKLAANAVVTGKIKDENVTEAKIATGAVTTDKLNGNAVTTAKIQNDAVTVDKLATDAVSTDKIKNDAVTEGKLAANAVGTANIKDAAVTPAKIQKGTNGQVLVMKGEVVTWGDGATSLTLGGDITGSAGTNTIGDGKVTEDKIKDNAVTESKIKEEAVTSDKLQDNAVTENKIKNTAVTKAKIKDEAVTENKLAASAVIEAKLANDAVTEGKIKNDAVTENKLAANAVAEAKIKNDAVTEGKIKDAAVTEGKIKDAAVTGAKLAENSVTSAKIVNNTIVNEDIVDAANIAVTKLAGNAAKSILYSDESNIVSWKGLSEDDTNTDSKYLVQKTDGSFATRSFGILPGVKVINGNSYTLTAADDGGIIYVNNTANVEITMPTNTADPKLEVGFNVTIIQGNSAGEITVTGVNSFESMTKLSGQYAAVSVLKVKENEAILVGELKN